MTRRGFLGRIAAAIAGVAIAPFVPVTPTLIFTEFVTARHVGEFCVEMYWQGELLCNSPRSCFILSDIAE